MIAALLIAEMICATAAITYYEVVFWRVAANLDGVGEALFGSLALLLLGCGILALSFYSEGRFDRRLPHRSVRYRNNKSSSHQD
jgi:hypothetical protein